MKICIIYGWAEGSWQGKRLRSALREAGFGIITNVAEADVLIAHSGGCFMLPSESKARLILLVGLPYWPGKHPVRSLQEKVRLELKDIWWYKKTFFNAYYFISQPKRLLKMWRNWRQRVLPLHESATITLVRNHHDSFTHPTDTLSLAQARDWNIHTLRGHHDDLWHNPEPYVTLLKKELTG